MAHESLLDALDLPPEAQAIQNAYWRTKREWHALEKAFAQVLREVLNELDPVVRNV